MTIFISALFLLTKAKRLTSSQKTGTDKPEDPLLKPVHAMLGSDCSNKSVGNEFLDWLVRTDSQNIIRTFSLSGYPVYCVAPEGLKRVSALYQHSSTVDVFEGGL